MIQIVINGSKTSIPTNIKTIEDLLAFLNLNKASVIVEKDGQIIEKVHFKKSDVSKGNNIEILHFIGGGSLRKKDRLSYE